MARFLKPGEMFAGCKIISQCGKGSFGVTYLALDPIDQKIIVKIISSPNSSERELNGLRHYMKIAGNHPNLLRILHIGEYNNDLYYCMEAADDCASGGDYKPATLQNLLNQRRHFPPGEALSIIRALLQGLTVIHQADLIHRDIKPDNIIFVNGTPKISDPGLMVQASQSVSFAGTLGFIPPEMVDGEEVIDQRNDLYALGKVFYCMVTGFAPSKYPQLPENMRIDVCRQLYPVLLKMCNRSPEKRFRSAGEFLAGLPEKLENPTRWESIRENFRNWCICNRELVRKAIAAGIILLLILLGAGTLHLGSHYMEHKNTDALKQQVSAFRKINHDRKAMLHLQIKHYLPDQYKKFSDLSRGLDETVRRQQWKRAAAAAQELETLLRMCAGKLVPAMPENRDDFKAAFDYSGKMHSFLATPLAEYLPEKQALRLKSQLEKFDKNLYHNWSGLKCGQSWNSMTYFMHHMEFVPSGVVYMKHLKKRIGIPYYFWVGKNEVLHKDFTNYTGISPQSSPHNNTPVDRVCWNDILYYCLNRTKKMQESNLLPPGYIIRPMNEAEWEYVYKSAWLGEDSVPVQAREVFKENSDGRSHPPGRRGKNRLGIFDIAGNLSEIVQPISSNRRQNTITVRGGSFKTTPYFKFRRIEYLAYQNIPNDIGFRVVAAPGDMSYFDRHFFLGKKQQGIVGDKVYELFGTYVSCFTWQEAESLCRLAGGRLAKINDPKHLRQIQRKLPLLGAWPTLLGGRRIRNKWIWVHDNSPIKYDNWRIARSGNYGNYLTIHHSKFLPVNPRQKMTLFLCEWDKKEYNSRNSQRFSAEKLPLELLRFSWEGRKFILFDCQFSWFSAHRYCEVLGGRLAELDSPELIKEAATQMKKYQKKHILLGGYVKFGNWYWLSGKNAPVPSEKNHTLLIPALHHNFITLKNGKLFDSQRADMLLFEYR